jgi:MFS family permease
MSAAIDSPAAQRAARYALAILTLINLFNYLDRWVVASVVESIKKSLGLSDTQLGLVGTGFIVVYTLTSPLFGALGDRRKRPPLIALGVAVWSVATSLAGFARGFTSLFIARSGVGVGEAAYGTIAPALLADSFPIERRGRVLAVFFCAIPIGSAAGYILGGLVDQHYGWRAAFWIAGVPGVLLSLLVLLVKDPPRGLHDAGGESENGTATISHTPLPTPPTLTAAYRDLFRNRPFILTALGYGAYTFALGGLGFWMPAFLERVRGMPRSEATVTFGTIALVTGFIGTFAGGWLGDFFLRRSKQSYLWVSGIATLIAAPAAFIAVSNPHRSIYLPAIAIAEVFIFMCTGPVNSAIINAVKPGERATAVGLSVLVMHVVGGNPSPPIMGGGAGD